MHPRSLSVVEIEQGELIGFDALASLDISEAEENADTLHEDWYAMYPQFSLKTAVSYLVNQWEKGNETAFVVSLTAKKPMKMLVYADPIYTDPHFPNGLKAQRLRDSFNANHKQLGLLPLPLGIPLMQALGQQGIVLCSLDAEDFELIVPFNMFSHNHLSATKLYTVEQSNKCPMMTGRVVEAPLVSREALQDPFLLGEELESFSAVKRCDALLERLWTKVRHPDISLPLSD